MMHQALSVCFPYEFTLLSNAGRAHIHHAVFVSPTNLHYSQTLNFYQDYSPLFVSPTNLHYSQTVQVALCRKVWFVSPTNLHYSQTET